jgi:hypothetical protein
VQRLVKDVDLLVYRLQGRLRSKGSNDAVVAEMLQEITALAAQFQDVDTRTELAKRAKMMLDEWAVDDTISPATMDEARRVLTPLTVVQAPAAAPAPVVAPPAAAAALPPVAAPPRAAAPAAVVAPPPAAVAAAPPPGGQVAAAAAAPVQLTEDMRAVDVLKAVEGRRARAVGLQTKWYQSNDDKGKAFSTAYNLGRDSNWEIHVHRNAKGKATVCTFQAANAVGNKAATRGMPLNDMSRLAALGIPDPHDPREQTYNRWGPL